MKMIDKQYQLPEHVEFGRRADGNVTCEELETSHETGHRPRNRRLVQNENGTIVSWPDGTPLRPGCEFIHYVRAVRKVRAPEGGTKMQLVDHTQPWPIGKPLPKGWQAA